jgi:hypothetical protein
LDELPVGAFSVAVSPVPFDQVPSSIPIYRYQCSGGVDPCLQNVWFAGYLSSTVHVEVSAAAGTTLFVRTGVRYPWEYPNGKGCGGSCRAGEISLALPD